MKTKKLLIFACLFILIMAFSACGNDTDNSDTGNTSNEGNRATASEIKIPQTVKKKLGGNLSVDAVVEAPTVLPKEAGIIQAKKTTLENKEKVMAMLFPNQTLSKVDERQLKSQNGQTLVQEYFKSSNKGFFVWSGNSLNCGQNLMFDIQEAFSLSDSSSQKLYPAKDLTFMTQKDAEKKARDLLTLLGVTASNDFQTFALDYQTMNQEQIRHQKETASAALEFGKKQVLRKWAQADDCYCFQFHQEVNGISILGSQQSGGSKSPTQPIVPTIVVYYGKQGFINAQISNIFETTGVVKEKHIPVSLDKALDALNNKFDEIIMNNPITVTNITLSYVPELEAANQKNYLLTPAWIFQLSQYSKDIKGDVKTTVLINALTGEEME